MPQNRVNISTPMERTLVKYEPLRKDELSGDNISVNPPQSFSSKFLNE